jgi:FtsZ-binding cell division protein ZapB
MDGERLMDDAHVSEGPAERIADLERRVEALRRTNEQLGRELIERGGGPRPRSASTAARAVAKLTAARDQAQACLGELEELRADRDRLGSENEVLRREVHRLRDGYGGLLRRLRARLLGR